MFLVVMALFGEDCRAEDFSKTDKNQSQMLYPLTGRITNATQLHIPLLDSTSTDSVTIDDTETRVIRTKSSKSDKAYSEKENSFVLEAGFPLSDMNFQYGLTYRGHLMGFGYYLGINRFSYSKKETSLNYFYDENTGNSDYVYDTTENSYSVTTISYGFFGSTLIAKKVDLVYSLGLMVNLSDSDDVFPKAGINLSLEGAYFFTKQLAAGVNTRGIFLVGDDSKFLVVPGVVLKVIF